MQNSRKPVILFGVKKVIITIIIIIRTSKKTVMVGDLASSDHSPFSTCWSQLATGVAFNAPDKDKGKSAWIKLVTERNNTIRESSGPKPSVTSH
jgi:hypothetical protein